MKKSALIISIIASIVIIAVIATIVFGKNTDKGNTENNQNIENDSISNSDISEKEDSTTEEQIKYWVEEYEFPKETNEFSLNLYNGFINVPLKLTDLEDKCDYFSYHGKTLQDRGSHHVEKISDIQTTLEDGATLSVYLEMNDNTYAEISNFEIKNLSEENKTAQECIENGWWHIWEASDYLKADEILGIEYEDEYDRKADQKLIEEVITKLGRPTRIIPTFEISAEKTGSYDYTMYYIVYEYSDFVLVLGIYEGLYLDSNEYATFDINTILYSTPESWEDNWINAKEGNLLD